MGSLMPGQPASRLTVRGGRRRGISHLLLPEPFPISLVTLGHFLPGRVVYVFISTPGIWKARIRACGGAADMRAWAVEAGSPTWSRFTPLGAPSQTLLPSRWLGWAAGELPLNSLAQTGAHLSCFKSLQHSWGPSG